MEIVYKLIGKIVKKFSRSFMSRVYKRKGTLRCWHAIKNKTRGETYQPIMAHFLKTSVNFSLLKAGQKSMQQDKQLLWYLKEWELRVKTNTMLERHLKSENPSHHFS